MQAGMVPLVAAIRSKARLRRLNLRENELEDEGTLSLAAALAACPLLESLDLCLNQV